MHDATPYALQNELENAVTRTPLSLRQMKFAAALYGVLAVGLIVALTMPAGVVVVASALGIVEW